VARLPRGLSRPTPGSFPRDGDGGPRDRLCLRRGHGRGERPDRLRTGNRSPPLHPRHPDWLRTTRDEDDFSAGLDRWSTFKTYGPVKAWGSPRTTGPECVPHPSRPKARVLHVRRPDDKPGDGAVWNFPIGRSGKLSVRILLRKGFQGGLVALTDRFFYPETIDLEHTTFALRIAGDGRLGEGVLLGKEQWYDLDLSWQVEQRPPGDRWPGTCKVSVDGREVATLPQLNRAQAGVGYLRLNSTAAAIDPAGFLVERVVAEVAAGQAAPSRETR